MRVAKKRRGEEDPCPNCQGPPGQPVHHRNGVCVDCGRSIEIQDEDLYERIYNEREALAADVDALSTCHSILHSIGNNLASLVAQELADRSKRLVETYDRQAQALREKR